MLCLSKVGNKQTWAIQIIRSSESQEILIDKLSKVTFLWVTFANLELLSVYSVRTNIKPMHKSNNIIYLSRIIIFYVNNRYLWNSIPAFYPLRFQKSWQYEKQHIFWKLSKKLDVFRWNCLTSFKRTLSLFDPDL